MSLLTKNVSKLTSETAQNNARKTKIMKEKAALGQSHIGHGNLEPNIISSDDY